MVVFKARCGMVAAVCLAVGLSAVMAGGAMASAGLTLCVPKKEAASVLTPRHGKCKKGYKLTALGQEGKEGKAGADGKAGDAGKDGAAGRDGAAGKDGAEGKEGALGGEGKEAKEQRETLSMILPHMKYTASGVGESPRSSSRA